jgi:hypothetical protein
MDTMNSQTDQTAPEITQHYKVPFSLRRFVRQNSTQLGIIGVLLALWLIFTFQLPKPFYLGDYYAFM